MSRVSTSPITVLKVSAQLCHCLLGTVLFGSNDLILGFECQDGGVNALEALKLCRFRFFCV